jgi:hypothetical protein
VVVPHGFNIRYEFTRGNRTKTHKRATPRPRTIAATATARRVGGLEKGVTRHASAYAGSPSRDPRKERYIWTLAFAIGWPW